MNTIRRPGWTTGLSAVVLGMAWAVLGAAPAVAAPTCAGLATDSAITGAPNIKSVTSAITPAAGTTPAYCKVNILYGRNATENINIAVGLPLSIADGGSGGVQGAWNGRTQALGGGGCSGTLNPGAAVATGYVGSGTDLGHSGGDCTPGVNADGTYNYQFIEDFIRVAIKQQVIWMKKVAKIYYATAPAYNYWNGCSTGGRQGYLIAQEAGDELDGINAGAPAMNWTRFQTAQMWGQVAARQLTGGPITTTLAAKLAQVRASAIAACDAADGITDGIIDDPRTCHFDAKANICGASTAPATNCLTPQEAEVADLIWQGPRNGEDEQVWYPLDRGTDFSGLDGPNLFALGVTQLQWDEHNLNFNINDVTVSSFAQVLQDGSRNIADVTDTFGPLDTFKRHGGKLLTFVGGNDQLIFPRGVIAYYRKMASRYSDDGKPDYPSLQHWYRLFRAPGVGHCGGGVGPAPVDPFGAMVNWVEHDVAPDSLLASGGSAAPATGRTRPVCPYPQHAIYNGTGSTDVAANFHCGGNIDTPAVVCPDVLAKYKHEATGPLDFRGTGVSAEQCSGGHDDGDGGDDGGGRDD